MGVYVLVGNDLFLRKPPDCKCGGEAILKDRAEIGSAMPGKVWVCENHPECNSYVGCHASTEFPLGTLADDELRDIRIKAHNALDWVWKKKTKTRRETYELLKNLLDLSTPEAHIGMLNVEQCKKVIDYFRAMRPYKTPRRC